MFRKTIESPKGLLALALLCVAAGLFFGASFGTGQRAHAIEQAGDGLLLSNDGFFVTSSSTGDHVYLWYFQRRGDRADSRVYFVSKASSAEGPKLDTF